MKIVRFRLIFSAVLLITCVRVGHAQGCRLDYTPNYDMYVTLSTDGTNIYSTVLTDGSTSGDASAGCNYPTATHIASSYNKLGSVGGWASGPKGCMTCYESVQNDQQIAVQPNAIYDFVAEAQVICSVFGQFFYASEIPDSVSIATTFGINTLGSQVIINTRFCLMQPNCSSGTPTCGATGWSYQIPKSESCFYQIRNPWVVEKFSNGTVDCHGSVFEATGPGPCD